MERFVLSMREFSATNLLTPMGLLCLLAGSAFAQPGTMNCGTDSDVDGPNVVVLSYCSPETAPGSAAGTAIRNGLCESGFFNSVDLVDGDLDSPTAVELQATGYQCAVVISEAAINDSNCPLDPVPGHILDTAATELASFAATAGGVLLLGGSMGPTTDGSETFRTEGLGDDMVVTGPSPYGRGPLPEGDRGGGPMNVSSPSGACGDMLGGLGTGDYQNLRVFEAGGLKPDATECARIVPVSPPGFGALAINAAGNVAAFTPNPIEEVGTGADTGDYLTVLSNTTYVVCRPPGPLEVAFDVRPETCPNPFNPDSNGKLPVAILGSADVNVADIDISSLQVFGVPPEVQFSISDSATPFAGVDPDNPDSTACTSAGADGFPDLNLKLPFPDISVALTNHVGTQLLKDQAYILTITGTFAMGPHAGESFVAHDVVRTVKDGPLPTP